MTQTLKLGQIGLEALAACDPEEPPEWCDAETWFEAVMLAREDLENAEAAAHEAHVAYHTMGGRG